MKKIGIIGGLAWPSTLDYYRLLCSKTNAHFCAQGVSPPYPTPPMVIESLNMNETRALRGVDGEDASWQPFEAVFRSALQRLARAGADFGLIASNTPHMRLAGITRGLTLPVISILDSTAAAVRSLGGTRALVLGTTVTMRSPVYTQALARIGVDAVPRLAEDEMTALARLIDEDLYQGDTDDARAQLLALCARHVADPEHDVVCLACTELPLAFPEHADDATFSVDGIWFVNTTVAHADAALAEALG